MSYENNNLTAENLYFPVSKCNLIEESTAIADDCIISKVKYFPLVLQLNNNLINISVINNGVLPFIAVYTAANSSNFGRVPGEYNRPWSLLTK